MKPHAYFPMESFWEKDSPIVFAATSPKEGLESRLSRLTYEKEKFLMELPDRVRECDADKRELFIQQQLSHYGDLSAQLMIYIETLPNEEGYAKITQFCQDELELFESIVVHIQKDYARYIDRAQAMPAGQLLKAKIQIRARVAALRARLSTSDTDPKLLNIALDPYERPVEAEKLNTYEQYSYCQEYLHELEMIAPDDDIDCKLRTAMVYMNFNTRAFLHYCYKAVSGEVKALVTTAEKLDKLEELSKIFGQLRTKPGCEFTKAEPSTVDLLLRIVKGEKKHIRKQKKIYKSHSPVAKDELPNGALKLKADLTVEQWGVLLKFLFVNKIITNPVRMDFLRIFASIIQTPKKDVISVDSLKSKFTTVSPDAKIWLVDTLRSWSRSAPSLDL
jgi:hypothetical protein